MGCSIVTASSRHPSHEQRPPQSAQSSTALWVGPAFPTRAGGMEGLSGGLPSPSAATTRHRRSPRLRSFPKCSLSQPPGDPNHGVDGSKAHPSKQAMVNGLDLEEVPPSIALHTPLMSPPYKGSTARVCEAADREYDGSASEVEDRPPFGRRRPRSHTVVEEAPARQSARNTGALLPGDPALHKAKHRSVGLPSVPSKSPVDSAGSSAPLHPPPHRTTMGLQPTEGRGTAGPLPRKPTVPDWRGVLQAEVLHLAQHAQAVEHRLATLMDAHQRLLLDPGPDDFLCPILREVMVDPVVTADGHTYERSAIAEWFCRHNTSPLTNQPLSDLRLIPNHALRRQILQWRERAQVQGEPERATSLPCPTKSPSAEDSVSSAMTSPSNNTTSLANTAASDFSFHPQSLQPSASPSLSVDSEDNTSSASYLSQVTAGSVVEVAAIVTPAPAWPFSPAPADDSPSDCLPDSVHSYRSARSEFSTQSSRPPTAP